MTRQIYGVMGLERITRYNLTVKMQSELKCTKSDLKIVNYLNLKKFNLITSLKKYITTTIQYNPTFKKKKEKGD